MVSKHTVTLANSIVGVSVLAMPFCFKQCGIILATLMLMLGAVMTRMVCYFLLKAGTITRRRNYEMLAWHTFGQGGKFIVEISIIGFLIGTLVAFFVVMGDLGPEIVSEIFDVENNSSLRNIIMTALSLFVALPLGLLRNIDSLSSVSTASVLFYVFLVCKILSEGLGPLFTGSYLEKIDYWRPAGVLQCIPIFSMALSCQTQIFGIYETLPEPSVQKMNEIVKQAVNICTVFYFSVGFFGYIAFCNQNYGGNIMMSFSPSWTTQLMKTCFLMSIVFSVPLVVFPCRASLHSLIFKRVHMHHSLHDMSTNYIPDSRLKFLTVLIIGSTLLVGISIPNIELVLGLVGSTTGTVICIIFPSIMFIRVTSKQTTERLLAQVLFVTGVVMMVVSTYATLYAVEKSQVADPLSDQKRSTESGDGKYIPLHKHDPMDLIRDMNENIDLQAKDAMLKSSTSKNSEVKKHKTEVKFEAQAPAQFKEPVETIDLKVKKKPSVVAAKIKEVGEKPKDVPKKEGGNDNIVIKKSDAVENNPVPPAQKEIPKTPEKIGKPFEPPLDLNPDNILKKLAKEDIPPQSQSIEVKDSPKVNVIREVKPVESKDHQNDKQQQEKDKDSENKVDPNEDPKVDKDVAAVLIKKLEEHEENQKKFLEEQRQMMAELKEHHAQDIQRQKTEEEYKLPGNQIVEDVKDKEAAPEIVQQQEKELEKVAEAVPPPVPVPGQNNKDEEVLQKKIIDNIAENIEKVAKNEEILDKIKDGLNQEIQKIETAPKTKVIKLPQPITQEIVPQEPIVVGPKVGKILENVHPKKQDDPIIKYFNGSLTPEHPNLNRMPPIPMQHGGNNAAVRVDKKNVPKTSTSSIQKEKVHAVSGVNSAVLPEEPDIKKETKQESVPVVKKDGADTVPVEVKKVDREI